ncbi:MarR family transcriptional regulator [Desulfovibrio mangrovi]|uniref:MarR family winged helix-turn-helix transcriptional regulator n=1 Tax=Desulfovibrio mangrovi TaxID=2976983 RepID=UPI002247D7E0|nr:MarR family transcriptional regulator [Desulfovibrio mangrovi]UZP66511.1 MarR family transcriptional regulator [Desulfovibrio mangrovi]
MDTTRLALGTYVKLARAAETITACAHAHLNQHNLTISQFGVLEALLHKGPLCQRALADKLLKTGGNMTTVVDNLEKRGLVRRQREESDRRFSTVHLTDEGRELIKRLFPAHAQGITELFSTLTAEEQEQLGNLCRKLGHACAGIGLEK